MIRNSIGLLLLLFAASAQAWKEDAVIDYVLQKNPLIKAHSLLAKEYRPPDALKSILQHTSAFARFSAGGTEFRDDSFTTIAGLQLNIPLASPKEKRELAAKTVDQIRLITEMRNLCAQELSQLRQYEADLKASQTLEEFYQGKSEWIQKRANEGYENFDELWGVAQRLTEQKAEIARLTILVSAQRHKIAQRAGDDWPVLLAYLEGKGKLTQAGG